VHQIDKRKRTAVLHTETNSYATTSIERKHQLHLWSNNLWFVVGGKYVLVIRRRRRQCRTCRRSIVCTRELALICGYRFSTTSRFEFRTWSSKPDAQNKFVIGFLVQNVPPDMKCIFKVRHSRKFPRKRSDFNFLKGYTWITAGDQFLLVVCIRTQTDIQRQIVWIVPRGSTGYNRLVDTAQIQGDPKSCVPIFCSIKNPFFNECLFCCRTW